MRSQSAYGPSVRCGVTFPPRTAWASTPEPVQTAVAAALGATIVGHPDLHGGMSPGPAAGLRLDDGRQVFVKAVSAEVRAARLCTDASIASVAEACRTASGHQAPTTLPPVANRIFDFNGWARLLEIGPGDEWEAAHAKPAAALVAVGCAERGGCGGGDLRVVGGRRTRAGTRFGMIAADER